MSNYVLITDSTTDLSPALIKEMDVIVMPLTFTIENKTYKNDPDETELPIKEFYKMLREEKTAITSQINVSDFEKKVEPILAEGKDILYLAFSSGLSGTFNSARIASQGLNEKYPNNTFMVIDTLCASMGEGLLVYHAAKMRNSGKSIDEVADWIKQNRLKLSHWFTVEDLFFLKRGGRVSGAAALLGTMLGIKPILHVDNEGHLIPMEKVRGRKPSLDSLVSHMEKSMLTADQPVFISHGDCIEDCQYVVDELKRRLGVKEIYINNIGPVIGTHSGPGTVALFFMGNER